MLKKNLRLDQKAFAKVLKNGRRMEENGLSVKFLPNRLNHPRFGLVLSKKVLKLATDRNLLRRQIFEIIQANLAENQINFDIIFLLRHDLSTKTFTELKTIFSDIIRKISHLSTNYDQR